MNWWRYLIGIPSLLLIILGWSHAQVKTDAKVVRVTLLQVGDVRQFTPVERGSRGGLARLMTIRKRIAEQSCTLLLLAGDTLSPSVESITHKGKQMIDAWNTVGLDYSVFGDHEFDFGPDVLLQRVVESKFGWLGANVVDKKSGKPFGGAPPYVIRTFNGVKIGIIGFTAPTAELTSRPGPDVVIMDPCDVARKLVPEMRANGAQAIIGLTHLSTKDDKRLAQCAGFDVILGGHEQVLQQTSVGGTLLFKVSADAREVNSIALNINSETGKLESVDWETIPITAEIADDPSFAPITKKYESGLAEIVGRTAVPLDARFESIRKRETNLGDFITDAMRKATGADIAFINSGAVRADSLISPGILTLRDILWILPFNNRIRVIEAKGSTILQALEHSVSLSAEELQPGRFLQVSGLAFTYDDSRPQGQRVLKVTVGGSLLEAEKVYSLASIDFLLEYGGDGYFMFKDARLVSSPEGKETVTDVFRQAITDVQSIAPTTDGRITRVDKLEAQLKRSFTCVYESLDVEAKNLETISGSLANGSIVKGYDADEVKKMIREAREELLNSLKDEEVGAMRAYVEKVFPLPDKLDAVRVRLLSTGEPQIKKQSNHLTRGSELNRALAEEKNLVSAQDARAAIGSALNFVANLTANSGTITFEVISDPEDKANIVLKPNYGKVINASTNSLIPGFWRGYYSITVTKNGYKTITQSDILFWSDVRGVKCTLSRMDSAEGPINCNPIPK